MKALICVDLQKDLFPDGKLPVPHADEVIPVINELLPKFDLIIFTKDWHPENYKSFASQHEDKEIFDTIELNGIKQILWPDHCIQDTLGADFHEDLDLSKCKKDFYIFKKGMDPEVDNYSAFYDNEQKNSTGLFEFLDEKEVTDVYVCGLCGDYGVKHTALDSAILGGYNTCIIIDAIRFVDDDKRPVIQELTESDVKIIESWELDLFNLLK